MKKIFNVLILLIMLCPSAAMAKKEQKGAVPQYQMEGAGMTSQNAQQVRVTIVTNKKDNVSDSDLEKAAVHGILFRDYDDTTNAGFGTAYSHTALMGSPAAQTEYKDFFDSFFDNGDYASYVQLVSDSRRVVKSGKEWKISAIVKVNSHALERMLVKQGIAKNLGSGW